MLRAAIRGFPYKNNVGSIMNRMKSTEAAPAEYSSSMKGTLYFFFLRRRSRFETKNAFKQVSIG